MTEANETAAQESYERLYRMWEESGWSATSIDFSIDAGHWRAKLEPKQREAALWNYAMFLTGVQGVGRSLIGVLDAVPAFPQRTYVATQIADEARTHVFLDRFLREVAGQGHDSSSTLEAVDRHLTWGFRQLFGELDRVADALRKKPRDRALLAQTVAICHVIVEGVLAIPGQHFIQRYVERRGILPGFSAGLTNIARAETRHVAFGTRLLTELVASSRECRAAVVDVLNRVLPWMVGVFIPPRLDESYVTCFDFTLEEIYAFGLRSLESKLERMGIAPGELRMISLDDRTLDYDERAARLLVLVRAGVLGDDRSEPKLDQESFEILFDGMTRAIDIDVASSLGGPIEWDFTDADPWHIVVTQGHAEAKPGGGGTPALRLEMASGDWAKVAIGRTDSRWALLTRKLRVHGHWQAKAKLAKLFH